MRGTLTNQTKDNTALQANDERLNFSKATKYTICINRAKVEHDSHEVGKKGRRERRCLWLTRKKGVGHSHVRETGTKPIVITHLPPGGEGSAEQASGRGERENVTSNKPVCRNEVNPNSTAPLSGFYFCEECTLHGGGPASVGTQAWNESSIHGSTFSRPARLLFNLVVYK